MGERNTRRHELDAFGVLTICRVKGLALAPGGELLFSASSDGTIKAWRIAQPQVETYDHSIAVLLVIYHNNQDWET